MNTKPDGGPAFPMAVPVGATNYFEGMSLRDWFAGMALAALIERDQIAAEAELKGSVMQSPEDTTAGWDDQESWKLVASASYTLADAMLAEREKDQ